MIDITWIIGDRSHFLVELSFQLYMYNCFLGQNCRLQLRQLPGLWLLEKAAEQRWHQQLMCVIINGFMNQRDHEKKGFKKHEKTWVMALNCYLNCYKRDDHFVSSNWKRV